MRIEHIEISGHPIFEDAALTFPGGDAADVVLLVGAPGSGKSAFLETVVAAKEDAAPCGARSSFRLAARSRGDSCKVRTDWLLSFTEVALVGGDAKRTTELIFTDQALLPDGADDDALRTILGGQVDEAGWFLYFDEDRALPPMSVGQSAVKPRKSSPRFIERSFDKFGVIKPFLAELAERREEEGLWSREAFNAALESGAGARLVGVHHAGGITPIFRFGSRIVRYDDLPSTTRQWLIFLGTFFYAQPSGSIVLIDAPEARLGIDGAARLIRELAGLGASNQFVVTTSLPGLAQKVESRSMVIPPTWSRP